MSISLQMPEMEEDFDCTGRTLRSPASLFCSLCVPQVLRTVCTVDIYSGYLQCSVTLNHTRTVT